MKFFCAWCPEPEETPEDASHSVCEEHETQLEIQSKQRQFDKVPSYFSERKQFEQYTEKRKRK